MYKVKAVIGSNDDGSTKYASIGFEHDGETLKEAVDIALTGAGTKDIFHDGTRVARVHPDGGVDRV